MKCDICGTESNKGSLIVGQGFSCSEDCFQIARGRRKAFHDELLAEDCGEMPDKMDTHDFERWSLKFALHFINGLSPKDRKNLASKNPVFLNAESLSAEFKERILRHIKPCYVSEIEYKGHSRMFANGEYCFRQPVPAKHVIEAARAAQLIN